MSSFTDSPSVKVRDDGRFQLQESFEYYYAIGKDKTESIVAPSGTITDFASIPPFLHWFMKPTHKHIAKPSIIHDILYSEGIINKSTNKLFTRKEADWLLFDMMRIVGAPIYKCIIVLIAVRIFGIHNFKK